MPLLLLLPPPTFAVDGFILEELLRVTQYNLPRLYRRPDYRKESSLFFFHSMAKTSLLLCV